MIANYHQPVLLDEVIAALQVRQGGIYCDATLGGGGHAEAILDRSNPDGHLVGIDRDPQAIRQCKERLRPYGNRVTFHHGNFRDIVAVLKEHSLFPIDGVLVDLGVSSYQLTTAERGFSFSADGPVDMRMDPTHGLSAAEMIASLNESELARVIARYGEEPSSKRIARAIKSAEQQGLISSTKALANVVSDAIGAKRFAQKIHPATRTFMALRMVVNDELGALEHFLDTFTEALKPGGRVAIISFHSLEDRAVKRALQKLARPCVCPPKLPVCRCGKKPLVTLITTKAIKASVEEIQHNPRARSARLRAAERV